MRARRVPADYIARGRAVIGVRIRADIINYARSVRAIILVRVASLG